MTKAFGFASAILFVIPLDSWACVGPGAERALSVNKWIGLGVWFLALFVAIALLVVKRWRALGWRARVPVLLVVLLGPVFWAPTRASDCGRGQRDVAVSFGGLATLATAVLVWSARRQQRRVGHE